MRPISIAIGILFLCSVLSAFNMTDYLYNGEAVSSVSATEMPAGSMTYTLYTIKSVPSMLVSQDGSIISQQPDIEAALKAYYSKDILPSDDEKSAIIGGMLKFNASRNYFFPRFGHGAEDLCLEETNLKQFPCNDEKTCYATAYQLCQRAATEGFACDTDILSKSYLAYSKVLGTFNAEIPDMLSLMDALSVDNAGANVAKARSDIKDVTSAAKSLANNKIGGLDGAASACPDCIGMCSFSHFDYASLQSADDKLATVATRLGPVEGLSTTARTIASNTKERLNYKASTALLAIWKPKWEQTKAKYSALEQNATTIASAVSDSQFTSVYRKFEDAWASMEGRMTTRNFDGVEADMNAIADNAPRLNATMQNASAPYLGALEAKNGANDELILARWNVRKGDSSSVSAYNALAQKKNALDAKFDPPMPASAYNSIKGDYESLISEGQTFISSQRQITDSVSSAGELFGQTAINAVFSLTDALYSMPSAQRLQVAPAIPPIVLFLIDLAVVSIALVVFTGSVIKFKQIFSKRLVLGVWIALLLGFLFVLLIGSVGMFLLIDQSSHSGTVEDFIPLLSHSDTAYIGIDQANAPPEALSSMSACAANISGQISAHWGSRTQIFTYTGERCILGNSTSLALEDCLNRAGDVPIMYLHYNETNQDPIFSVVYQKKADLTGTKAYYDRCEIGDVLN